MNSNIDYMTIDTTFKGSFMFSAFGPTACCAWLMHLTRVGEPCDANSEDNFQMVFHKSKILEFGIALT